MWKTQSPLHQLTTAAGYARATSAHSAWPAGKFLSLFGLQASRFLGFSSQTSPATNSKLHVEDIKEVFNLKSPIRRSTSLRPSLRQGFAHCTITQPPRPGNNAPTSAWFLQNVLVPAGTRKQQSRLLSALQPEGFQQV